MRKLFLLLAALTLLNTPVIAEGTDISAKLDQLSKDLVSSYRAAHPGDGKVKAAVLEFTGSKELERKRIGFAVAELLTHHMAKNSDFHLLERMELNKLFAELKLSMSGAVSNDEALQAGKIGGVKILVLGNVEKIGVNYYITARLVDSESSQVAATAYTSVPIHVFEEEAKDYLVYVPEKQGIGIYFLYNWRYNPNNLSNQTLVDPTMPSHMNTAYPNAFPLGSIGVGIRYAPSKNLLIDISTSKASYRNKSGYVKITAAPTAFDKNYSLGASSYRGILSLKSKMAEQFFCYYGGGFTVYSLYSGGTTNYLTPTALLRVEYLIQKRAGLSVSAGYDFYSQPAKRGAFVPNGTTSGQFIGSLKSAELGKFYLESSLSVYF